MNSLLLKLNTGEYFMLQQFDIQYYWWDKNLIIIAEAGMFDVRNIVGENLAVRKCSAWVGSMSINYIKITGRNDYHRKVIISIYNIR